MSIDKQMKTLGMSRQRFSWGGKIIGALKNVLNRSDTNILAQTERPEYKILKGDTLSQIARDQGTTVGELAELNKIKNPDLIYAGQKLRLPQAKSANIIPKEKEIEPIVPVETDPVETETVVETQRPSMPLNLANYGTMIDPNTGMPEGLSLEKTGQRNRLLPLNMRQLIYDISGGSQDLTENDLTPEEYDAAKEVARNAIARGSNTIQYRDYQTVLPGDVDVPEGRDPEEFLAYADVGGSMGGSTEVLKKSFADPRYALKTTLGQASIYQNEAGETIIEDRYNFNEKAWRHKGWNKETLNQVINDLKNIRYQPEYFGPRRLATWFGSAPGEGSIVKINLGII